MKKLLTATLVTISLFPFTACNQVTKQAEDIKNGAEETIKTTTAEAERFKKQAEEAKAQAEEKLQQAQDAADAIKKLAE